MRDLQARAESDRRFWREKLGWWQATGKTVVGYGAPAKATVWLNWIGADDVDVDMNHVVDSTPEKWFKYIPGTGISIWPPSLVLDADVVVVLAHNHAAEIVEKLRPVPAGQELWDSRGWSIW